MPDIFHIILDALTTQRDAIKSGNEPWRGYDAEDDPKSNRQGYLDLLDEAEEFATKAIEDRS